MINIFPYGDSKTQGVTDDDPEYAALGWGYVWRLLEILTAATGEEHVELPLRVGRGGTPISGFQSTVDADLATRSDVPKYILVNIGTGDKSLTIDYTTVSNYGYVLDAFHTKWPNAIVYCARPWQDTSRASMAKWNEIANAIEAAVKPRPWAKLGIDERIFLEYGDNGNTFTSVGHPNHFGYMLTADEWASALLGRPN